MIKTKSRWAGKVEQLGGGGSEWVGEMGKLILDYRDVNYL